jgi:SNF2 family DNA or RNA helicase
MTLIALRSDDASGGAIIKPQGYLGGNLFDAYRAAVEGSRFDGLRKVNVAPLSQLPRIVLRLREAGFALSMDDALTCKLEALQTRTHGDVHQARARVEEQDVKLRERGLFFYGYQKSGVDWLASRHSALLSDDMGLGKTCQAIMAAPENAAILVVCPAIVKGVWRREVEKWRPELRTRVLEGRGNFAWPSPGEVVVVNYDILPGELAQPAYEHTVLIFDEAHNLKSSKTKRNRAATMLASEVRAKLGRVWLLTATPLLNRPQELWNILDVANMAQEAFGSWKGFCEGFKGKKGPWGGMVWGLPTEDVAPRLQRVSLRRLKRDVLPDLPTKTWREIPVAIDTKTIKICDAVLAAMAKRGKNADDVAAALVKLEDEDRNLFECISAARAALAVAKTDALFEVLSSYEEEGAPVVVFSAYRAAIDALTGREGWRVITGDTPPAERTEIEELFQRGELRGVGCTIKAGGVGITLTAASDAIFLDLEWTPALNAQAEDRLLRIGQKKAVVITQLVAEHELDERLAKALSRKEALTDASVEASALVTKEVELLTVDYQAILSDSRDTPRKTALPRNVAETVEEIWTERALRQLASSDADRALVLNGVGFNRADGQMGHSLVEQLEKFGGLTRKQWDLASKMCSKYKRQLGE